MRLLPVFDFAGFCVGVDLQAFLVVILVFGVLVWCYVFGVFVGCVLRLLLGWRYFVGTGGMIWRCLAC